MSENQPTPQYNDDEIDLRKLFHSIGNFFRNIGRGFINIIIWFKRLTIKYYRFLLAAIIIGAVYGALKNITGKEVYETSMLIKSDYFNAKMVENAVDKLNLLCEEEQRLGLASVLQIDTATARNIVDFEYEPFVSENDVVEIEVLKQKLEELKVKDPDIQRVVNQINIQNKNTFLIKVRVFDNQILEEFQTALVGFFRNTPYVRNRIETNKEKQKSLISKLESDIATLDSLKKAYNLNLQTMATRPNESSNNVYVGEGQLADPVSIYSEGVNLFRQLQSERQKLALGDDFEVIDGFTVFSKPASPGLLKNGVMFAGIFLAIAYLIIFVVEINKYLSRVEKEGFDS